MLNNLLEREILPDSLIRYGVRLLLKQRLKQEDKGSPKLNKQQLLNFSNQLRNEPIAVHTEDANEQHYEVPAEFFEMVLGKNLKYSCAFWQNGGSNLDKAETDMLSLTSDRAQLGDRQTILDLGCGWGSLSLFVAEKYPNAKITAVSNSKIQKQYIKNQIQQRSIHNLKVVTSDIREFHTSQKFDRIVSTEMFEHMRNYEKLLNKLAGFLEKDGKLFIHIFTHKTFAYLFEVNGSADWMAKHFFTGGMMPSEDLLYHFNSDLKIEKQWRVNGKHYQRTSEAWLKNMDNNKDSILQIFKRGYGDDLTPRMWAYWRIFFMACAELFGYNEGNEWMVNHYLLSKNGK